MINYKPIACGPVNWKEHSPTPGSISACGPVNWKEHSPIPGSISACGPDKAEYAINLLKDTTTKNPVFNSKEEKEQTKPSQDDPVNHPKHYTSHPSGIETIEITRWMNFNLGNSIKYILRSGKKSEDTAVQDLEKAVWYINDEIKRLKGEYNK